MGLELGFRELGEVPYEPTWHAMQRFVAERDKSVMDEAWLLQHPAVFTQGQ
ncbi:octanoyltransferase, partial [Escherichia coli]|nr:octanoyltransferase [Escherichia coli]